jgi:hypothetical protein
MLRLAALFFLSAAIAIAQISTATLTGTITDPTQARIPGVIVKVINEETGVALAEPTNSQGDFTIPLLPPGRYRIDAEAQGFKSYSRSGVVLEIGRSFRLDIAMELGQMSDVVKVSAAAPLLESEDATISQLIEHKTIVDMPLNGQRVADLAALMGNAIMVQSGINFPRLQIAGGRADQQSWILDGTNASNLSFSPQSTTNFNPPVETIQEFRILQNNYSAEYGNTVSGVVSFSTRSGTNEFHGAAYEFFRNDAMDAIRDFAATKPPLRWNTFGGSAGGPIRRNHTFFFAALEHGAQRIGVPRVFTVPTALQKNGDFSQTVSAAGVLQRIYDPATTRTNGNQVVRDPFPGNVIPANRFDTVGANLAGLFPNPTQPASNLAGANNFNRNSVNSQDNTVLTIKVDHLLRATDRISWRLVLNDFPQVITPVYDVDATDPVGFRHRSRNTSSQINEIHNFTTRLINDFRFNWGPRDFANLSFGLDEGWPEKLGLKGASPRAFPRVTVNGLSAMGPAAQEALQNPLRDTQLVDQMSWFRGSHSFKFGGETRIVRAVQIQNNNMSGTISVTPQPTSLPGTANTGFALAALLLGVPNAGSFTIPQALDERSDYIAGFIQDNWRVAPNLTLNLGIRWETHTPRLDANDRQNGFDLGAINPVSHTPGVVTFAGRDGLPRSIYNGDYNNFGPRVGLAWRVLKKMVIRSGYGIAYAGPQVGNSATAGFQTAGSFSSPDNGVTPPFLLRNGFPGAIPNVLNASYGAVPVGQPVIFNPSFVNPNFPSGYSQQWNLSLQRDLGWRTLLDATYMGIVGHKLHGPDTTINQVPPQLMGPGNAQIRRPFPQFGNVSFIAPAWGNSTYHSLTIKFEKRFSNGLNFLANYTFAKFIDDVASGFEVGDPAGGFQNFYNRRAEKSLSGNDVRNAFAWSSVYEIPVGNRRRWLSKGFASTLLGGWNMGLIVVLHQGSPFGLVSQTNNLNAFNPGPQRVNILRDPALPVDQRSLQRWFDTTAVATPPQFQFGNAGRTVLTGPGLININMSLLKNHRIGERFNIQMRVESFNLMNHPNFLDPATSLGSADFGVINSAMDARVMQLGLKLTF